MISIIKFLHLICGTTILGIIVASFFYIAYSIHQKNQTLINYSIKVSYFGDGIILLCTIIQFITSAMLITAGHFPLTIPWIRVAHIAFGIVVVLWIAIIIIKFFNLSNTHIKPYALRMFYFLNILIIFIFMIII